MITKHLKTNLVDMVLMAVTPLDLGAADAGDRPRLWVRAVAEVAEEVGDRPRLWVLAVEAERAAWAGREMWRVAEDGGAKGLEQCQC